MSSTKNKFSLKKIIFFALAPLIEIIFLPLIAITALHVRFFRNKRIAAKTLFMGMMHINNWTYVADAMRARGYFVQVVPWMIPDHEVDVIPYDINFKKKFPRLYSGFIGQYILTFGVFIWAIFTFKIFLMPFKARILERTAWLKWIEIPLLHLAGKKVILNTFGGDVATPRLRRREDLKYSLYDGYMADPQYRIYNERAIARNARVLERQADFIISAIDHVDYLDRVDAYFHLRCIDTNSIQPNYDVDNKVPVLVHAPNHRLVKGTDQIITAVENLNKRGIACELKIIENTSNAELMEIIRHSDAVVDQLLLGTYARLSIEAMALGKPVFCYLRDDLYQYNPIWTHCPIMNVNPDTIEQCLEDFLQKSKGERVDLGKKGREYIEQYHSLDYVGGRFDDIINRVVSNDEHQRNKRA